MRSLFSSCVLVASSFVALPALADPGPSGPIQGVVLQDLGFQSDVSALSGHRAVGNCTDADGNPHAAMWDLRHPGDAPVALAETSAAAVSRQSQALSIDGRWAVGGEVAFDESWEASVSALLWDVQSPGAAPVKLPWDGPQAVANAVHGTYIVGGGIDAEGAYHALLWDLKKPWKAPRELTTTGPAQPTAVGSSFATGALADENGGFSPLFWDVRHPQEDPIALSFGGGPSAVANATSGRWAGGYGVTDAGLATALLWDLHRPERAPMVLPGLADGALALGMDEHHIVGAGADLAEDIPGAGLLWDVQHPDRAPTLLAIDDHLTFAVAVDGPRAGGSAQSLDDYARHAAYWDLND